MKEERKMPPVVAILNGNQDMLELMEEALEKVEACTETEAA